jgi:hypothetical protein
MGIPGGSYVATGFGSQRIVVIPTWKTVIVHQIDTSRIFEYVGQLVEEQGYTVKGALIYVYMCKYPVFAFNKFCRECGWAGDFITGSNFVDILSKILEARLAK